MKLRNLVFSSLFSILIVIGSYISIPLPFTPVPLTLQLFFVLLSGVILGPYFGFLSVLMYEILGIIGFPVFAGGQAGLSALLGPTGGYLLGFLIAPLLIGYMFKRNEKLLIPSIFFAIFAIHTFGVIYLSFNLSIPLLKAFYIGSLPFIPVDLVKGILAYMSSLLLLKNKEFRKLLFFE